MTTQTIARVRQFGLWPPTRDTITYVIAISIILKETFLEGSPEPSLLTLAIGMLGLPIMQKADKKELKEA